MTTAVRRRRGTTAQHATFTGLEGEISIDTTKDTVVVHDGTTAGGHPLAKENNTALTGNVTVTTNSPSPALTITQDGTGNALEVRDVTGDSTPFMVDANGRVVIGKASEVFGAYADIAQLMVVSGLPRQFLQSYDASVYSPVVEFAKSRHGTLGSHTTVAANDGLGVIRFAGSDGTAFKLAAQIEAQVDGTPGTNDMPGRLVFSTTADGASSPTERMRIDSSGNVGIGGAAGAANKLDISGTLPTSAAYSEAVRVSGTIPSGATSNASMFISFPSTQAATFTLGSLYHFRALQNSIGAGSAITNQYGFHSDIPAGAGRWNFYASSAAANYFGGNVTVGGGGTLGYGTGSGGTVTQATSKSTAVTLNKPSGAITMHNAALAAGASVVFTVNNNTFAVEDTVVVTKVWDGIDPANYRVEASASSGGGFQVRVTNISGGSLSDAVALKFALIKGATS